MTEHGPELELRSPAEERVGNGTALETELDPVRQEAAVAGRRELVAMFPMGEGTGDLDIDKQPIAFELSMLGDPDDGKWPQFGTKHDFGSGFETAFPAEELHVLPGGSQQGEDVIALMEGKNFGHGGVYLRGEFETHCKLVNSLCCCK